jgi:hypothetical protein
MTGPVPLGFSAAAATARNQEARAARRSALDQLSGGQIDFQGLVTLAAVDPDVANLRIASALASMGWDPVRVEEGLRRAGVALTRRVRWLFTDKGLGHRDALYDLVAERGRPNPPPEFVY